MISKKIIDRTTKILFSISFLIFIFIINYSPFRGSFLSPDQSYRLDYYQASIFQEIWNRNMVSPYTIYLYNNIQNTFIGKTPLLDIEGGNSPVWLLSKGRVSIMAANGYVIFENIPDIKQKATTLPLPPTKGRFLS
jgi:hypothetical protein